MKISFNVSSIKPNEDVKFSELRIFKKAMSLQSIQHISNNICDLNKGVNVSLLAEMNNGQLEVIEKQLVDCQMLEQDDWIVFSNVSSILNDWIKQNNNNKYISITLEGGCGLISPESIGIKNISKKLPLLAAFLQTNENLMATQEMLMTNLRTKREVTSAQSNSNNKANPHQNHACKINSMTVNN